MERLCWPELAGRRGTLDNFGASVFIDGPMQAEILALKEKILAAIAGAMDSDALEAVRIQYLARSGDLPVLLEKMATVPKEERPVVGRAANETKTAVQAAYEARKADLAASAEAADFDPTLPGRYDPPGSLHPVLQVRDRAIEIFRRLGFALADGPDIENEAFNFDALNTPPDHPARNEQDTFYIKEDGLEPSPGLDGKSLGGRRLLRTQTSTVQIRAMLSQAPPLRVISPGRCYRRDEIDATHGSSFTQMEGLVVGEGVALTDLKGTLEYFFRELLGEDLKFRFRPHFFPFTEPSFEVDCSPRRISGEGQAMAGDLRLRHGGSGGFPAGRLRCGALYGLCFWVRDRAHCDHAAWHSGFAIFHGERCAVPAPV